jgi:hypothetical protein
MSLLYACSVIYGLLNWEDGVLVAQHPVLEGRRHYTLLPGHRKPRKHRFKAGPSPPLSRPRAAGSTVARRELAVYEAVGRRLAAEGRRG